MCPITTCSNKDKVERESGYGESYYVSACHFVCMIFLQSSGSWYDGGLVKDRIFISLRVIIL